MFDKRVVLFMGHYGSGKTFCAVNYALALAKNGKPVTIYDLDIVNPYFRTVDAEETLKKAGVELIVSPYAETNVDIPAMNAASYKMVDDRSRYAVLDIGGDDRGALALGRFYEDINKENDFDCLFVVNPFRPETRDIDGAISVKNEIETVSRVPFTGIVNNANLGKETNIKDILYGKGFCEKLGEKVGLKVKFSAVTRELCETAKEKIDKVLSVDPIKYGDWL
ncbi:MAG: hypothetical protein J5911_03225 [Clostridia bacterium]|nr:hypothetical protein [Clostridia bacterium]